MVVDPPSYAAATLNYPAPPQQVRALLYDAERQALLVAVSFTNTAGNQILRYQFANGSWSSTPTSVVVPNLRDIALSLDGTKLLVLSDTSLTLADPATLALGNTTSFTFLGSPGFEFFRNLVVANDGFAFVTTGLNGSGFTEPYLYSTSNPGFTSLAANDSSLFLDQATPGISEDGSVIAIMQSDNPPVFKYVASSSVLSSTGVGIRQIQQNISQVVPSLNRSAARIVLNGNPNLNGGDVTSLYDGTFTGLGGITDQAHFPSTPQAVAILPDGTRAYTFDSSINKVRTFDLTQPPSGGLFPEVGTGTAANPGAGPPVRMKISPDGGTLFVAAGTAIVILPAP
jgi:sugar lactone lactonase YvrE